MTSRKRKSLYLKSSAYTSPFESESDEQVADIDSENDLCNKKVCFNFSFADGYFQIAL